MIELSIKTELEHRIIGLVVDEFLADGYRVTMEQSGSVQILVVFELDGSKANEVGFVQFVRGNGPSIISDYSVKFEGILKPVIAFADMYEA
jgi:hypothetical protein